MLHLLAWSGAKTDSTADEAAPAVADLTWNRGQQTGTYIAPYDCTVVGAFAMHDAITRARINSPRFRDLGMPEIDPLIALAEPSASFGIAMWGANGPRILKGDEVGLDSSNGAGTVDTIHAGIWVSTGMQGIPNGRRVTVRGTAAQTLVASAWTSGAITLGQGLPNGRYGVIGMRVTCNDGIAARLAFPNDLRFRPGVVVGESIAIREIRENFRAGQFGLLGEFDTVAPPSLEVLGGTAGAETPAVILDLVEMGASRG